MSKKTKLILLFLLGGKIVFLLLFIFVINAENTASENEIKFAEVENMIDFSFKEAGTVKATWYGNQFHGKRTASGEIFDENLLTAAHRTLPFGTLLKLTNAENGNSIVIRVNDRGPMARSLDLDLSKQAAIELGIKNKGVSKLICSKVNVEHELSDLLRNY